MIRAMKTTNKLFLVYTHFSVTIKYITNVIVIIVLYFVCRNYIDVKIECRKISKKSLNVLNTLEQND